MVYRGLVKNGVIVLDDEAALPEGTVVTVDPVVEKPRKSIADRFRNVIGTVPNLPSDMAKNHDHYLHGARKK